MRAAFLKYYDVIRASYWFIPSVMAFGAFVLSFLTTAIDGYVGTEWLNDVQWLYANKPEGARSVLSTVAGSMITVAGVTFSITIVAVAYASSQFGPRLLTSFMRDRGNQITLGTFIATFLYCLLVLRTVRSADEQFRDAAEPALNGAFVPHIAVLCGLLLAVASVGVLIFFIHHIPESIHVSNVVANVGRKLNAELEYLFPEKIGQPKPEDCDIQAKEDIPVNFDKEAVSITANSSGYIQNLDEEGLLSEAKSHDLVLRLNYCPGDFVSAGQTLILAWPPSRVDESRQHSIRMTFAWGAQRTATQDVLFVVNELVEVAARALSPGINDPFTAMSCLDWLQSSLIKLAHRQPPERYRYDEDGKLRVIADRVTFALLADVVFGQLRQYFAADRNASLHMMAVLVNIGREMEEQRHLDELVRHAKDLRRMVVEQNLSERDVKTLDDMYAALNKIREDATARQSSKRRPPTQKPEES